MARELVVNPPSPGLGESFDVEVRLDPRDEFDCVVHLAHPSGEKQLSCEDATDVASEPGSYEASAVINTYEEGSVRISASFTVLEPLPEISMPGEGGDPSWLFGEVDPTVPVEAPTAEIEPTLTVQGQALVGERIQVELAGAEGLEPAQMSGLVVTGPAGTTERGGDTPWQVLLDAAGPWSFRVELYRGESQVETSVVVAAPKLALSVDPVALLGETIVASAVLENFGPSAEITYGYAITSPSGVEHGAAGQPESFEFTVDEPGTWTLGLDAFSHGEVPYASAEGVELVVGSLDLDLAPQAPTLGDLLVVSAKEQGLAGEHSLVVQAPSGSSTTLAGPGPWEVAVDAAGDWNLTLTSVHAEAERSDEVSASFTVAEPPPVVEVAPAEPTHPEDPPTEESAPEEPIALPAATGPAPQVVAPTPEPSSPWSAFIAVLVAVAAAGAGATWWLRMRPKSRPPAATKPDVRARLRRGKQRVESSGAGLRAPQLRLRLETGTPFIRVFHPTTTDEPEEK